MAKTKILAPATCTFWIVVLPQWLQLAMYLLAVKPVVGTRAPCYNISVINYFVVCLLFSGSLPHGAEPS